jgi:hypothetical protein
MRDSAADFNVHYGRKLLRRWLVVDTCIACAVDGESEYSKQSFRTLYDNYAADHQRYMRTRQPVSPELTRLDAKSRTVTQLWTVLRALLNVRTAHDCTVATASLAHSGCRKHVSCGMTKLLRRMRIRVTTQAPSP